MTLRVASFPCLNTLLSSVEEATGTQLQEVPVPSYALHQLPHWHNLLQWCALGASVFYTVPSTTPPIVYLADVQVLVRGYFDAPAGWERFVAVDERTPQEDRRLHYIAVGKLVRGDPNAELHATTGRNNLYGDFGMLRDRNWLRTTDNDLRERLLLRDDLNFLQGVRHIALLRMMVRGDSNTIVSGPYAGDPDWTLINWRDVAAFNQTNWCLPTDPEQFMAIVWVLPPLYVAEGYAGLPCACRYIGPQFYEFHARSSWTVGYTTQQKEGDPPLTIYTHHIRQLFDNTLSATLLEPCVSTLQPDKLGLGCLYQTPVELQGDVLGTRACDSYSLIALMIHTTLMEVQRQQSPWTDRYTLKKVLPQYHGETVEYMAETLGTRALAVCCNALLRHSVDNDVMSFLEHAVSYLEVNGTGGLCQWKW